MKEIHLIEMRETRSILTDAAAREWSEAATFEETVWAATPEEANTAARAFVAERASAFRKAGPETIVDGTDDEVPAVTVTEEIRDGLVTVNAELLKPGGGPGTAFGEEEFEDERIVATARVRKIGRAAR